MAHEYRNLHEHEQHGFRELVRWKLLGRRTCARPPFSGEINQSKEEPLSRDYITWIGHSSFLLSLKGKRFLLDPILSDYCSPVRLARFLRKAPPGLSWNALDGLDAAFISHNHYDHLDRPTILRLPSDLPFMIPRGLGPWFRRIGRLDAREFDWWNSSDLLETKITCVPAQHFSSRTLWDRNRTLWCGWIIKRGGTTVYFAGDTGYCPVFSEIGKRYGPIDLAIIPIGAYAPRWFMKPMHVNPEEAVQIHADVGSRKSVACHWGTFCLTDEPMSEPPVRLRAAMRSAGLREEDFLIPRIGESVSI